MTKRKGFDSYALYYGTFNIANHGIGEVHVYHRNPPYIWVEMEDGEIIIFNARTSDATQSFYAQLLE